MNGQPFQENCAQIVPYFLWSIRDGLETSKALHGKLSGIQSRCLEPATSHYNITNSQAMSLRMLRFLMVHYFHLGLITIWHTPTCNSSGGCLQRRMSLSAQAGLTTRMRSQKTFPLWMICSTRRLEETQCGYSISLQTSKDSWTLVMLLLSKNLQRSKIRLLARTWQAKQKSPACHPMKVATLTVDYLILIT